MLGTRFQTKTGNRERGASYQKDKYSRLYRSAGIEPGLFGPERIGSSGSGAPP